MVAGRMNGITVSHLYSQGFGHGGVATLLNAIFNFYPGPPPGGPGVGTGLQVSLGESMLLGRSRAASGGVDVFLIFILALSAAR